MALSASEQKADRRPARPRWPILLGILAIALVLLLVAVHLALGGFRHHLPASHEAPAGPTGSSTTP